MNVSRITTGTLLALTLSAGGALADPGGVPHHHQDRGVQIQLNPGRHLGHYRHLQAGYLSDAQIAYAIRNRSAEMVRLRSMRSIDYSRVRIVRLTAAQKARFGVGMLPGSAMAYDPFTVSDGQPARVAQIFNGNSQFGNILQTVLAGIVVQNAIGSATGGTGGSTATLANVLLNSGIPLSDLLGVFMGGNGILNALVG